ncbi:hypothetical protein MC885_013485 [Smutsia gigantea]|nr:hypothetical protein MC885_013485 [Smutsia gigantea]
MKLFTGLIFCSLVLGACGQWYMFLGEAAQVPGPGCRQSQSRPGAEVDARENSQRVTDLFKYGDSGHGEEDAKADQEANEWGRSGKDPNHFRPAGLPDKY